MYPASISHWGIHQIEAVYPAPLTGIARDAGAIADSLRSHVHAKRADKLASTCMMTAATALEMLKEQVETLRKGPEPHWFYYGDETSSENCSSSVEEALESCDLKPGQRGVFEISTGARLPSIWVVVEMLTDAEKDALDNDEDWQLSQFSSHEDAADFLEAISEADDDE